MSSSQLKQSVRRSCVTEKLHVEARILGPLFSAATFLTAGDYVHHEAFVEAMKTSENRGSLGTLGARQVLHLQFGADLGVKSFRGDIQEENILLVQGGGSRDRRKGPTLCWRQGSWTPSCFV
jgi:hypothetical protein